jgi:uncharacterized membrane protein YraQ (UPF0718 family)
MKTLLPLYGFTLLCILASFSFDRRRTRTGLLRGMRMFLHLMPSFLTLLALASLLLTFLPRDRILCWLGRDSGYSGFLAAGIAGSIAMVPGFIAFPLCGILLKNGASVPVIAVFVTTLMMVGVLTLPLESRYFGLRAALLRNGLSFIGALVIGAAIGLLWGRI